MALVNPFRPQICDNAVQGLLESRVIFGATHPIFFSNVNNSLISIFTTLATISKLAPEGALTPR